MNDLIQAFTALIGTVVAVIALWSARSTIIGHAFDWLKKLFIFLLIDSLFRGLYVTFHLQDLQTFAIYILNEFAYKVFPEQIWIFLQTMLVLTLTYEMLIWIVGHHHVPGNHKTHPSPSQHG